MSYISKDVKTLPDVLKALPQFLLWKSVRKKGRQKTSKIPYYLSGIPRNGVQGSPGDIKNLGTFEEALKKYKAGGSSGIGIAKLPNDGLIALDCDDCIIDGKVDPKILDLIRKTYAEASPSGHGVRAFFKGSYPDFKNHREGIEVFCDQGFVTLTANRLNSNDIIPLPENVRSKLDYFHNAAGGGVGASRAQKLTDAQKRDPVYQRLKDLGWIKREFEGGKVGIHCPNESMHSADTGDGQTVYFVKNTFGFSKGHFKCLHAGCADLTDADFLRELDLDPAVMDFQRPEEWPDPLPL